MTKKFLLSLIIIPFLGISVAFSQCIPDPALVNTPGVYPDSATGLPHGNVNSLYETTMTVVVPTDTVFGGFTVPIDSIGITAFSGLPSGFSYAPNRPSGFWAGGTAGCVLITGMNATVGSYPLSISVMGYASGMSVPFTIDYYIIVLDSAGTGIIENNAKSFEAFQNSPNPFTDNTEISFNSDINGLYNIEVYNMIGKVVYTDVYKAAKGLNKINFSAGDLPQGIYFYKISNGQRTATKRMVVAAR